MAVIINEMEVVVEPPAPAQPPDSATTPPPPAHNALRPLDLADIQERRNRFALRLLAH